MQMNYQEDFDRQIRSMLADAEEKVPSGVWRAVSGRLDAAASPRSAWRWAVPCLAAAFAAVLVFTGIFNRPSDHAQETVAQIQPLKKLEKTPESAAGMPTADYSGTRQMLADNGGTASRKSSDDARQDMPGHNSSAVPTVPQEETSTEPQIEDTATVETASATDTAGYASSTDIKEAGEPAASAPILRKDEEWSNPFAQMAWEDAENDVKRGISLTFQGAVGGNDASLFASNSAPRFAPVIFRNTPEDKKYITEGGTSNYGVPVSFGIGARFNLIKRLSIGAGINYSLLTRTFSGTYTNITCGVREELSSDEIHHSMHYLGIPVNLYFNLVNNDIFKFYVHGGGTVEYCVSNKYSIRQNASDIVFRDPVHGLQLSAGIGLGVQFQINEMIGVYLDPSARYYFKCEQPRNVRTDKPFMANFELGLRFDF